MRFEKLLSSAIRFRNKKYGIPFLKNFIQFNRINVKHAELKPISANL